MDLDTLVAESDPARHAGLPGPDSPEGARLYRQITERPPRRGRVPRPGLAIGAGLAATAVAAVLVALNLPDAGPARPARPARAGGR